METKKYLIFGALLIIVLVAGISVGNIMGGNRNGFLTGGVDAPNPTTTGGVVTAGNGEVQNAQLALVDFSYKLTPNTLIAGVPVRVEVDASTLSGCMTTVVIKEFGVTKRIRPGDNIIEFTPDKTGTFWITCSMGMGPGSFKVVNPDGSANDSQATTQTSAPPQSTCGGAGTGSGGIPGSCGGSGGGCGCGG